MDRKEMTVLLNADIYGEHQAILYYLTHAWTVAHQYGPAIEGIARDEMRHLKWVAHTVVSLQGVPDLSPPKIEVPPSLENALVQDIAAETEAILQYEDHQSRIPEPRIKDVIGRILVDERNHREQFRGLLQVSQGESWGDQEEHREQVDAISTKLQTVISAEYGQVLSFLFESFITRHQSGAINADFEERAIEDMRHLAAMAEFLVGMGGRFSWTPTGGSGNRQKDLTEAIERYRSLEDWAKVHHPDMVPVFERIIGHESFQQRFDQYSPWTVGPLHEQKEVK